MSRACDVQHSDRELVPYTQHSRRMTAHVYRTPSQGTEYLWGFYVGVSRPGSEGGAGGSCAAECARALASCVELCGMYGFTVLTTVICIRSQLGPNSPQPAP